MNLSPTDVSVYLPAFVADQQVTFGGQINPVVVAARNQSRKRQRLALTSLLCVAVTAKSALPMTRWLPGVPEPKRVHVFYRAIHPTLMEWASNCVTTAEYERALGLIWHMA